MPKLPPRPTPPRRESNVLAEVRTELARLGIVHWRNNTGALKDDQGRLITYGLCTGSADLIAIVPVDVRAFQDGRGDLSPATMPITIGRFVAIEVKKPGQVATYEQRAWLEIVRKQGGVAVVVDDASQIAIIIQQARRP